ncbi:MAG: hypothetical protein ACAH59_08220 [Pseudobdellovibrionaceae bacterium]
MKFIFIAMATLALSLGAFAKGNGKYHGDNQYIYTDLDPNFDINIALAECGNDLAKERDHLIKKGYTIVSIDPCTAFQSAFFSGGIQIRGRISFAR